MSQIRVSSLAKDRHQPLRHQAMRQPWISYYLSAPALKRVAARLAPGARHPHRAGLAEIVSLGASAFIAQRSPVQGAKALSYSVDIMCSALYSVVRSKIV